MKRRTEKDPERRDPQRFLDEIAQEEHRRKRGKLKIFFGYAAGVGKTYAMLEAAHEEMSRGVDVVVGYVEPHRRPKTQALLEGLEVLDPLELTQNGISLHELDLDAAIRRHPQLILVDELAHTNAKGARHNKRYQDVKELLAAGIDVYTTVNIQHLESLHDKMAAITGVTMRERIPDAVFDEADSVELVDIEPDELIARMKAGEIYEKSQAQVALEHFFKKRNLKALREIALRRGADRLSLQEEIHSTPVGEHILVCLSPSPSNASLIRTGAQLAGACHARFTALYVETPDELSPSDRTRLDENIRLAAKLGAQVETVYGEDVPRQIASFAHLSGVSKIVIGRSASIKKHIFSRSTLTERLMRSVPNLDMVIIPENPGTPFHSPIRPKHQSRLSDWVFMIASLACATLLAGLFHQYGLSDACMILAYVLAVLIVSVESANLAISLIASVMGVLLFNYLFTIPYFAFAFGPGSSAITVVVMFAVSLISGTLAIRLRNQAESSTRTAYRTRILFDTEQLIEHASGSDEIVEAVAGQLVSLLGRTILYYPAEGSALGAMRCYTGKDESASSEKIRELDGPDERAVANWVFQNNKHAGAGTQTLGQAKCRYLAIRVQDRVYGVIGIVMGREQIEPFENSILQSILGELALALENEKTRKEAEEAAALAREETLRANLLREISHDLRTPLTTIAGNAQNLLNEERFTPDERREMTKSIEKDARWLNSLVENLLSITRIEGGEVELNIRQELLLDVVEEAVGRVESHLGDHQVQIRDESMFVLARMDAPLVVQVLVNLIENAVSYTPDGSIITISARSRDDGMVEVFVADDGEGVRAEDQARIFDRFYCGDNPRHDGRRSTGLGLSLCRSVVESLGGEIHYTDNHPHGAVFSFTLPVGEEIA